MRCVGYLNESCLSFCLVLFVHLRVVEFDLIGGLEYGVLVYLSILPPSRMYWTISSAEGEGITFLIPDGISSTRLHMRLREGIGVGVGMSLVQR